MKNSTRILTVLLCLLVSSLAVNARNGQIIPASPQASSAGTPGQSNLMNAILPFYSEDFASGLPATWQAIDSTGNVLNWKYTTVG